MTPTTDRKILEKIGHFIEQNPYRSRKQISTITGIGLVETAHAIGDLVDCGSVKVYFYPSEGVSRYVSTKNMPDLWHDINL